MKQLLTRIIEKVSGRAGGAAVLRNAGWLFFDKIFRTGLNFILTAVIARQLGVSLFGKWNYAIAFVALFSFLSSLGLFQLLSRDFVREIDLRFKILRNAFVLKFTGAILTVFSALIFSVILNRDEPDIHLLIVISGIMYIGQSMDVLDYFFQSQLQSYFVARARLISFLIFGAAKVLFLLTHQPLIFFVWAQSLEFVGAGLLLLYTFRKNYPGEWFLEIDRPLITNILRQTMPILFAEIAIILYMRVDQILIGRMLGESALGVFSAAVKLSEIWFLFPTIICSSLSPAIVEAHRLDATLYRKRLQYLYDILAWISLSISLVVTLLSGFLVHLVYGDDFAAAAPILTIHVWSGLFVFWGTGSGLQLVVENQMKISFYRTLFGMVSNVVLNIILIPLAGPIGSAVASLISYAASGWISNLFFAATRDIFWMNLNCLNPVRLLTFLNKSRA